MFLELVATSFQDARRRSADDALWNGKREIYFKESLDIRPCVVAWRWQSDAASLECDRIVLVLHSWWTFTARR